jgi:hypothetical protein
MTAANWTADELDRIGRAEELEIAPSGATRRRAAGGDLGRSRR